MYIKIILFALFSIAIFRFLMSENKNPKELQFYLLSSCIQSLMIYPILLTTVWNKEYLLKLDFSSPYENYTGIMYPTVVSLLIFIIARKKKTFIWKSIKFPLLIILVGLFYSFFTPYNYSKTASVICLVIFLQIFIVLLFLKKSISDGLFLKSVYDGFTIIVIIEFFISFTYVFLGIDAFQSIFSSDEVSEMTRYGSTYKLATGTTSQHNRLGALCAYLYVFFFSCWTFRHRKKRSLYLAISAIFVVVISQSRSALIASVISSVFLYLVYTYSRGKLSLSKIIGFTFIFVILGGAFLLTAIAEEMFFSSNMEEMSGAREMHYLIGWNTLNENNFYGCGMNSNTHYMYYQLSFGGFDEWLLMHSIHSTNMVIAVELGVIGLLFWLYYLISRISRIAKTPVNKMNSPILWYTFGGMLIVMFIHGFSDCVELHYQYLMIISLFGAFYTMVDRNDCCDSIHKIA